MLKKERKILVIDTSVLLYDKNCIKEFRGNDVYIPLIVLEELDRFKNKEGILGENARDINRFLDDLRQSGNLNEGCYIEESDIIVKVWSEIDENCKLYNMNKNSNDNVIIAAVHDIRNKNKDQKITLITKDINLRVKCDAIKIDANDYYADYNFIEEDNLYTGASELSVEEKNINTIYNQSYLSLHKLDQIIDICENEFIILKGNSTNQSCLSQRKGNILRLVESKEELKRQTGIEAKNKEQIFALELLIDDDIPLVTLTGVPGSGKTYLTLMVSLREIEKQKKNRIIFTRPIQTVGKDIGFLPGTLNEKMTPWLAPIVDNFRNQFGDLTYFDLMLEKGQIDIAPLSHIRGRSFNDAIIIVDEAQNATVHELKTVITRTGKNSKVVLLGDTEQVDLAYINKYSNGLTIVTEKLKNEHISGHVHFNKGYRSELANIVASKL
tara:strand:- start:1268 stop:2587 length:1320 start_codon:yes stop_codon:yes gene_type:complete